MEQNTGFVIQNSKLKGYLNKDKCFSSNLIEAVIYSNEPLAKTEISKLLNEYEGVEAYHETYLSIKPVLIQETIINN